MKENKKDPFTNVTNAERLSPEDRECRSIWVTN